MVGACVSWLFFIFYKCVMLQYAYSIVPTSKRPGGGVASLAYHVSLAYYVLLLGSRQVRDLVVPSLLYRFLGCQVRDLMAGGGVGHLACLII